jgi:two-component system, LuxR family, response regulator FixJ
MMGSAQTDKGKVLTMASKLAGSRPLVIVVDDDLAVRSSLQFSLEMEGFAVHTYADGRELLDGSDLAESSCLVIDHRLPGMTGLETIAKLRQRRVLVPAILMTTHPTMATVELAKKADVPIVEKPLLENALLDQIRAALDKRHKSPAVTFELRGRDAMSRYRVSFFKNVISSDGHCFRCLQQSIEIRRARNPDRAIEAAERRYERIHRVSDWRLFADALELQELR